MRRPDSPCLNCEERHVGCHSECDAYKAFKVESDKYNGILRDARERLDNELARTVITKNRYFKKLRNEK